MYVYVAKLSVYVILYKRQRALFLISLLIICKCVGKRIEKKRDEFHKNQNPRQLNKIQFYLQL